MRIIAGRWKGHSLRSPRDARVRPTSDRVREAWMSMLGPRIAGARVLDLFAGSGALGLETLSRGAREVVFVERAASSLRLLRDNVERLGVGDDEVRIVRHDALRYLRGLEPGAFDVALADPPYRQGIAATLLQAFSECPFARELWVEHASAEPLPELRGLESRRYGDTTLTRLQAEP